MIGREEMGRILSTYGKPTVGVLGSHSALDVADGAKEEGLRTLVVAEEGRHRTYERYFRTRGEVGCVDRTLVVRSFRETTSPKVREALRSESCIWVPNRSFTSYIPLEEIESSFDVPIFGNRFLLGIEERGTENDYYDLLRKAGLPYPEEIRDPTRIESLVIVKLPHAQKRLERGFFTASSFEEFQEKSAHLVREGVVDPEDLKKARIEKYVLGPVFNLNFFWSPLSDPTEALELLGIDWRFESNLDGLVRLPAAQQLRLRGKESLPEMNVVGHNLATLRESLLEKAFEMGERFVEAASRLYPPGVVGPFCLQTCVDENLRFFIYDVAPRIGGGTNVHMAVGHPYGNALWRRPMSTGRRIALEIRRAYERGRLSEIVT